VRKLNKEGAINHKCPSCGASISFNPTAGKWKCEYCGNSFTLEELTKNTQKKKQPVTVDNYNDYTSYHCNSCGAEIIADKETSATFCVYCGNTAILQSKLTGKFQPQKIIPFKNEKELAINAFKELSRKRPLMPKDFNSPSNIEKIRGIYIPFWLYNINVKGNIEVLGKKVKHWCVGNTHYTKTSDYKVVRGGSMNFTNIPIDGSTRFDNDIMNTLEPFNYDELIPYNHAYLSGFLAEKYDIEGEELFNEVSKRALNSAQDILENDIKGYSSTIPIKKDLIPSETGKEYALLPVWMVNVKYKDKMYIFAMNGQTGEFIGNIPLDSTKTILYTIIIFVIIFLISILVSYLIYIIGG